MKVSREVRSIIINYYDVTHCIWLAGSFLWENATREVDTSKMSKLDKHLFPERHCTERNQMHSHIEEIILRKVHEERLHKPFSVLLTISPFLK